LQSIEDVADLDANHLALYGITGAVSNGFASHRISMIDALVRPIPIGNHCRDSGASNRQPRRTNFFSVVAVRD
jgi:hypothetical protein